MSSSSSSSSGSKPPRKRKSEDSASTVHGSDVVRVDLDRQKRCGFSEVIFGAGKTPEQIVHIARQLCHAGQSVLVTRTNEDAWKLFRKSFPAATFEPLAGIIRWQVVPPPAPPRGFKILICAAGTSDIPVAEEAAITAEFLGNPVERLYDVGVAGIDRLLSRRKELDAASIIIAVAGMEGALPSVIGGLVACPVIAVPTSIGYGANLQGIAALLGMLNSCASGLTVVNIDNGFGAAAAAERIKHSLH